MKKDQPLHIGVGLFAILSNGALTHFPIPSKQVFLNSDLEFIRFGISDSFDFGFGISDCGINGKAHGAEGIALEVSEISELSV